MTSSLHAARRVAPVSPLLSVILAARDPEAAQFDACVASIAALRHSQRLQLVIVVSGHLPAISEACQTRLHSIDIVEQEPGGVYHAYNRGLDEVRAPYVMVMGCDDLLLPGLDPVLDSIDDSIDDSVDHPFERRPHLVAACVLAQGYGIARPTRFRWGLIFRVWCQQGLLYRSDVFAAKRFDCRYPVQADHKFNMELVSNPRTVVAYRDDVICHFSSGGLSSMYRDSFRNDMPGIVRVCYGPFFWLLALTKRELADLFKKQPQMKPSSPES
jgi:glycosyltransferase involved in cell wall biosynthesis